jgi:PKD repeat protein
VTRRGAILAAVLVVALPAFGEEVLVELGHPVVYLANSSDPGIGTAWTAEVFPNAWASGTYGVGYGAGPLVQTAVAGPVPSVYTRAEFTIVDVGAVQSLFLGSDYDDGYAVWLNGVEVFRTASLPPSPDPILWNTFTSSGHESTNDVPPDYGPLMNISSAIGDLHDGTNVLAVGVWNRNATSSDLVVVPKLVMNRPLRGPYLQLGRPSSLIIRWRTNIAQDSRVAYGPAPDQLTQVADETALVTDHEVKLTGLSADTVYYYSVGDTAGLVLAGADGAHFFRTAPVEGTRRPIRVWAIGDSGTANNNARRVRDSYEDTTSIHTDVWLMLGDNAYNDGTDPQYQDAVFDLYEKRLPQTVLWPTIGNHDEVSANSNSVTGVYYDIFTLHDPSESGTSSGTEAYYSFDFGNIHFVSINSLLFPLYSTTDMLNWLTMDLMNTSQDWIVAFEHHPPYSKGSHDSDSILDSVGRLFFVREEVVPILEAAGVDLLLAGHSHSYERSFLLNGHHDVSGTLIPAMKLDDGDGRVDGSGAYEKLSGGPGPNEGAVYVVAGSSGKTSGGSLNHPAHFISLDELGSVVLDVNGDRMDVTFLDDLENVDDYFTIVKDTGSLPVADFSASATVGPAPLSVDFTDLSTTNTAAWAWDFEDDASVDSTERAPSHVYATPGFYTVELQATNQTGTDVETKAAYICASGGIPAEVTGLAAAGPSSLGWTAIPEAAHYDVVKGDLGMLRSTGGDYSASLLTCLEDDDADLTAADGATPPAGTGYFYVVRGSSTCGEPGTYDSGGSGQSAARDAGIIASPMTCN